MTPHALTAIDNPAEFIMIFDRDGQRAHIHHEGDKSSPIHKHETGRGSNA